MKWHTKTIVVPDHVRIGRDFRVLRKTLNLSLRTVAKVLDVSAPFLSDLERGNRTWTKEKLENYTSMMLRYWNEKQPPK